MEERAIPGLDPYDAIGQINYSDNNHNSDGRRNGFILANTKAVLNVELQLAIQNLLHSAKMLKEYGLFAEAEEAFYDAMKLQGRPLKSNIRSFTSKI